MMEKKKKPIYLVQAEVTGERHLALPFGSMFVGKALTNAGWRVRVFHLGPGEERELFDAIRDEKPLFLGVNSLVGFALKWLVRVSRQAHEMGVPVVWGGPFASMVPGVLLREDHIKHVVVGEGERNTPLLAEAIAQGEKPKGIPGVGYSDGGEIFLEPPEFAEDIDQFEPGWELVPIEKYYFPHPQTHEWIFQIIFSRGCPYNCSFCHNRIFPERKAWRAHSLEYIKAQLEYLNRRLPRPIGALSLVGDNALGSPKKGKEIIQGIGLPWLGALRIEMVDEEFVRWSRDTSARYFVFGFESASDRMQKVYDRNNNSDQFRTGLGLLKELDIIINLGVIFFGPTETIEDRRATVELMEELYVLNPRTFFTASAFYAQPGTTIWERVLEQGFKSPENLDEWSVRYLDFMKMHGWSLRKWARVHTTGNLLYGVSLLNNPLKPGWSRRQWYKRFRSFSFKLPVEEAVRVRQKLVSRGGG